MMNNNHEEYEFSIYTDQEIMDAMAEEDGEKLIILNFDRLHFNLTSAEMLACQTTFGCRRNHWIVASRVKES